MQDIEKLVAELGREPEAAYRANRQLEEQVVRVGTPGQVAERTALAAALGKAVESARAKAAERSKGGLRRPTPEILQENKGRCQTIRLLALVAGEPEVATLRSCLEDPDVSGPACEAIERIPGPGATAALIHAAHNGAEPGLRIAALNGLGKRQGPEVTKALQQCVGEDASQEVRLAACEALASQPDAAADDSIVAVLKSLPTGAGRPRLRLTKARIRLAETLAGNGQKTAAKRILESLLAEQPAEPQKKAAQLALDNLG